LEKKNYLKLKIYIHCENNNRRNHKIKQKQNKEKTFFFTTHLHFRIPLVIMNTPCNTLPFQHPPIGAQISCAIMSDQLFNSFFRYLFDGEGENP